MKEKKQKKGKTIPGRVNGQRKYFRKWNDFVPVGLTAVWMTYECDRDVRWRREHCNDERLARGRPATIPRGGVGVGGWCASRVSVDVCVCAKRHVRVCWAEVLGAGGGGEGNVVETPGGRVIDNAVSQCTGGVRRRRQRH